MNKRDKIIAAELQLKLREVAGDRLRRIIFFGSRVHGVAREDSDLDVAVLVTDKTADLEKGLEEIVYQIMWDRDFSPIISLKVLDVKSFEKSLAKGFHFYKQLEQEGVEL